MSQDLLFAQSEGDNWFLRNKEHLSNKVNDRILDFLHKSGLVMDRSSVLEIGCANGFRLNLINKTTGARCVGIDISREAIMYGNSNFPDLSLSVSSASSLEFEDKSFDFVIINFVLHWVDRFSLMRAISEIDRVVKEGGIIVIGDFCPAIPKKVKYHHLPEGKIFTYKQDYKNIFISTNLYELIHFENFSHSSEQIVDSVLNEDNRCSMSVLRKDVLKFYTT